MVLTASVRSCFISHFYTVILYSCRNEHSYLSAAEMLLNALARMLREEGKRSIDLTTQLLSAFFHLSTFPIFHNVLKEVGGGALADKEMGRFCILWQTKTVFYRSFRLNLYGNILHRNLLLFTHPPFFSWESGPWPWPLWRGWQNVLRRPRGNPLPTRRARSLTVYFIVGGVLEGLRTK